VQASPIHDSPFDRDLDRGPANHVPLSPLAFLDRAAHVWPDRPAVLHGGRTRDWRETAERCRRLASALSARGIRTGDTVSVLAPNVPALLEAHFGVPGAGAVLNAINTRLDPDAIAFVLAHGGAKVFVVDAEWAEVAARALARLAADGHARPLVVRADDPDLGVVGRGFGDLDYEALLAEGDPGRPLTRPDDEWRAISLNYTSGTTGDPKGVVYHHRGAYLNAVGNILAFGLGGGCRYLWVLPMFHCNGWSYPWAVTAVGGLHVCLRRVMPREVFRLIADAGATHLCAAPAVLTMLIHAPAEDMRRFDHVCEVATGGAAPPSAVIAAMERMGFRVTHLYGLTESFGPATLCAFQDGWADLDLEGRARMMARQGVGHPMVDQVTVADPATLAPVPADGLTMGEVMLRSNTVMKGYLKNPKATAAAFAGGWFRTGDLGVLHADGYIEVKDRAKDVIITGGENVSSLEVEELLYRHPAIMEAAVVARPDPTWGESPCAFVTLREGASLDAATLTAWARERIARFKVPRSYVFGPLPKTSTGKIQKFLLRERARELAAELPAREE
jgi:fatty-acyl-CoA synthase